MPACDLHAFRILTNNDHSLQARIRTARRGDVRAIIEIAADCGYAIAEEEYLEMLSGQTSSELSGFEKEISSSVFYR